MKSRSGFTILETIIVLAVTSFLLIGALASISGRQGRTQFVQGVRETESQIKDMLNDVNNGILPDLTGFVCATPLAGQPPQLSYSATAVGASAKNEDCVLAGKVIQFGTDTDANALITYSVAGRRNVGSGVLATPVSSFDELKTVAIDEAKSGDNRINATEQRALPWGIKVVRTSGAPAYTVSETGLVFGILYRDFKGTQLVGGIASGSSSIGVMRVATEPPTPLVDMTRAKIVTAIDSLSSAGFLPAGGPIVLCLKSNTSDQYAVITIGNGAGAFATNTEILGSLDGRTCG